MEKTTKDYSMRWIKLNNKAEAAKAIEKIGSDPVGVNIMAGKAVNRAVKLEQVPLRVAHILKQSMLSLGGDAAVHRDVIVGAVVETDLLLMGSLKQYEELAVKLAAQPFGLKQIGVRLSALLKNLEPPAPRTLDCRGRKISLGERTLIMGILNITPDSFSDGGKYFTAEHAVEQANRLIGEGADILDIGAESTRPGHREVSAAEEWERLEPVLHVLTREIPVPISLDTAKAEVAAKGLEAGVHLINDIWGLQKDPDMARVAGEYQAPVIVMHNQQGTEYRHLIGDILDFLRRSIALAEGQGLSGDQIILDPGIGFGKTTEQNLEVMARLEELRALGYPVLLGTSRKSMIGNTLNLPVNERLEGTIATSVIGAAAGVDIVRVHDVLANRRAVEMADAIYRKRKGTRHEGE